MTRVYEVCFVGITAYVAATNPGKAKMKAVRSAKEAGYWHGASFKGLRCKLAAHIPLDTKILEAR